MIDDENAFFKFMFRGGEKRLKAQINAGNRLASFQKLFVQLVKGLRLVSIMHK